MYPMRGGHVPRRRQTSSNPWARIEKAADEAARQVIEEDRMLREYGIQPPNGRTR